MAMANIVANFSPFPSHPSPLSSIYLNPSLSLSLSSPFPPPSRLYMHELVII